MRLKAGDHLEIGLDPGSVLDIRGCFVDGVDCAPHRAIPDDGDSRIDHSLEGFLFTCGPDHIRHREPVAGRSDGLMHPLHGPFSGHKAEDVTVVATDFGRAVTARVPVQLTGGGSATLFRRYEADDAKGEIRLIDRLDNTGDRPFPAMLMYHMNVAGRLFDDGTRLAGRMFEKGGMGWRFGPEPGSVFCVPAGAGDEAELALGPVAALSGRSLVVRFDTGALPYLQMWRNQQAPADVMGIEPCTHRWVDRATLAAAGELPLLQPGAHRDYRLSFAFTGRAD